MVNLRLAVAEAPTRRAGEAATKPVLAFVDSYGEVVTPCGDLDPKRVQLVRDWLDEAQRCIESQQGTTGTFNQPPVHSFTGSGYAERVTVAGVDPGSVGE